MRTPSVRLPFLKAWATTHRRGDDPTHVVRPVHLVFFEEISDEPSTPSPSMAFSLFSRDVIVEGNAAIGTGLRGKRKEAKSVREFRCLLSPYRRPDVYKHALRDVASSVIPAMLNVA